MNKLYKKLTHKIGLPPGEVIYVGKSDPLKTNVNLIKYEKTNYAEEELKNAAELNLEKETKVNWICITGFENVDYINEICKILEVNDLLLEDALHTSHIPKFEEGDDYLSIIIKSFDENDETPNHNCIILKENVIISLFENSNNLLSSKIERIRNGKAKARNKKADYLFYTLLDTFIDSYYRYFENIREKLFDLENIILQRRNENHIDKIYELNNKLTAIRKNLFPLKIALLDLSKSENKLINKNTHPFLNDCKDHVNELIEYYNSFTEMIQSLINLNDNNVVNNTNKVMKILTIIATIFIPLTFIAGIYGMNFKYMPELDWQFGYFLILFFMFFIAAVILLFMKKKNWF